MGSFGMSTEERSAENCFASRQKLLESDVECTGHGIVDFYLASNSRETYVFVYLEEILPSGKVLLITEGLLNTRHRKIVAADQADQYDPSLAKLGVPQHSYKRVDDQPLRPVEDPLHATGDEIARLQFDLLPTSYLVRKGNRIQISISGTDTDHFQVPTPLPKLAIFHGPKFPSRIRLPVIR